MIQRYTAEEDKIVLENEQRIARRLLPHRTPACIAARRYKLRHLSDVSELKDVPWSAKEKATLRENYGAMPNKELIKLIPGRTIQNLMDKARRLKLRKKAMLACTIDGNKEMIFKLVKEAKDRGIASYWLDRYCGTRDYFGCEWRRMPINVTAVVRAAEFLGGRLDVVFDTNPFGVESRRLIECLVRFGREEVPRCGKVTVKAAAKLRPAGSSPFAHLRKLSADDAIMKEVDALVPRGMPGRDDIVQMVRLALVERTITIDDLRRNRTHLTKFLRSFMRGNFEQAGYAMSMDSPLRDGGQTLHDVLPDRSVEAA